MFQQQTTRACPQRFINEIQRLSSLKDGWCDGTGSAMIPALLDMAQQFVLDFGIYPGIAPTYEGGLQLIWEDRKCVCWLNPSLEMDIVPCLGAHSTFNMGTEEGKEGALSYLRRLYE